MATTSVSPMSSSSPKPDSSLAGSAATVNPADGASSDVRVAARIWPATAAVPWPITSTRRKAPVPRPLRTEPGSVSSPRLTVRRPSASTTLPRNVLRNDSGASDTSFSRKWGKPARSTSRVVISATVISPSATGSAVPS